ncbi:MAG: hypothetical protein RRY78_06345 [Clostridia bacterium]
MTLVMFMTDIFISLGSHIASFSVTALFFPLVMVGVFLGLFFNKNALLTRLANVFAILGIILVILVILFTKNLTIVKYVVSTAGFFEGLLLSICINQERVGKRNILCMVLSGLLPLAFSAFENNSTIFAVLLWFLFAVGLAQLLFVSVYEGYEYKAPEVVQFDFFKILFCLILGMNLGILIIGCKNLMVFNFKLASYNFYLSVAIGAVIFYALFCFKKYTKLFENKDFINTILMALSAACSMFLVLTENSAVIVPLMSIMIGVLCYELFFTLTNSSVIQLSISIIFNSLGAFIGISIITFYTIKFGAQYENCFVVAQGTMFASYTISALLFVVCSILKSIIQIIKIDAHIKEH